MEIRVGHTKYNRRYHSERMSLGVHILTVHGLRGLVVNTLYEGKEIIRIVAQ